MSVGIYPVFNPRVPEAQFGALGEVLAANLEDIERIAATYAIPGLSSFGDRREVPPDFNGSPDDLERLLGPRDDWYEASDGKAAFQALAEIIVNDPEVAANLEEAGVVVAELEELARVLEIAEQRGAEFRLEVS